MSEIKVQNVVSAHRVKEGVRLYTTECTNLPPDAQAEAKRVGEWNAWMEFVHELAVAAAFQAHDYKYSTTPHSRQELSRFIAPYTQYSNLPQSRERIAKSIMHVVASSALLEATAPVGGAYADSLTVRYTQVRQGDEVSYHTIVLCHRWALEAWAKIERVVHNQVNGVGTVMIAKEMLPV